MNKFSAVAPVIERPQDDIAAQAYLHTLQAGAWVPLQQAGITGALAGLLVTLVCLKYRVTDWWFIGLIVMSGVTIVMWGALQKHWFSLTTVKLENMTGLDLNRDGKIGQAKTHSVRVNIHESNDNGYQQRTQAVNLPIDEQTLATFASALLGGRPLTEREWAGSGKPLSIEQFREMRGEMLKRGLAALSNPKSPQQGYKLTRAGRAVMEHFAALGQTPSPTPPADDL
jgi:hypothetical protein